ncbi:MAG: response regulator [Pseudomonadota bacterium]
MPEETTPTSRNRIVVIEDSEPVRKSLELLLRTRGYDVETFEDGEDLLKGKDIPDADCFLIDFRLPNLDGIQVLEGLRDGGYAGPAILITASASAELKTRAKAAGFLTVIEKPPHSLSFINEIARAVDDKGTHRAGT